MKRLKVQLIPGWVQAENPDGPPTFVRSMSGSSHPLQVSHAEYMNGKIPNPTEDDLVELSKAQTKNFGEVTGTARGKCVFGKYGMASFRSKDFALSQVWHLSDGQDFIFITYICDTVPDTQELREAETIIKNVYLGSSKRHWWKFWQS